MLEIAILISKNYAFNIKIIKSTELINEKNFLHDALVILDLFEPQKIFNDAKNKINQKKILAPNLLRINFKN